MVYTIHFLLLSLYYLLPQTVGSIVKYNESTMWYDYVDDDGNIKTTCAIENPTLDKCKENQIPRVLVQTTNPDTGKKAYKNFLNLHSYYFCDPLFEDCIVYSSIVSRWPASAQYMIMRNSGWNKFRQNQNNQNSLNNNEPTVIPLVIYECMPEDKPICTKDEARLYRTYLKNKNLKGRKNKFRQSTSLDASDELNDSKNDNLSNEINISDNLPSFDGDLNDYAKEIGKVVAKELQEFANSNSMCPLTLNKLGVVIYPNLDDESKPFKVTLDLDEDNNLKQNARSYYQNKKKIYSKYASKWH